jgi:hypothetical protein
MAKQHLSDVVEKLVRGLVQEPEDLQDILVGVHNAMCHGEILEEKNIMFSDDHLVLFFKGMDKCIKAAKKINKFNL